MLTLQPRGIFLPIIFLSILFGNQIKIQTANLGQVVDFLGNTIALGSRCPISRRLSSFQISALINYSKTYLHHHRTTHIRSHLPLFINVFIRGSSDPSPCQKKNLQGSHHHQPLISSTSLAFSFRFPFSFASNLRSCHPNCRHHSKNCRATLLPHPGHLHSHLVVITRSSTSPAHLHHVIIITGASLATTPRPSSGSPRCHHQISPTSATSPACSFIVVDPQHCIIISDSQVNIISSINIISFKIEPTNNFFRELTASKGCLICWFMYDLLSVFRDQRINLQRQILIGERKPRRSLISHTKFPEPATTHKNLNQGISTLSTTTPSIRQPPVVLWGFSSTLSISHGC